MENLNTHFQPSELLKARFRDLTRTHLLDLERAIRLNDLVTIETITHKMAGNSGIYGFPDVGVFAGELCQAVTAGQVGSVPDLFSKLSQAATTQILQTSR